jgi:hypothetical protein
MAASMDCGAGLAACDAKGVDSATAPISPAMVLSMESFAPCSVRHLHKPSVRAFTDAP